MSRSKKPPTAPKRLATGAIHYRTPTRTRAEQSLRELRRAPSLAPYFGALELTTRTR